MNVLVVYNALQRATHRTSKLEREIRCAHHTTRKNIMTSIRWALKCGSWQPDQAQWLLASSSIQSEEKNRIGQFVFTKDAKSAMTGRLLARKAIHENLNIPWKEIQLVRTNRGKPYLMNTDAVDKEFYPHLNFNTSHHGDFAVFVMEPELPCGVDVMKVDKPNQNIDDFFRTMQRQFTPFEWQTIMSAGTQCQQLHMFYRHWCLKESYIKAIGIGLGFDLQRAEFRLGTKELSWSFVATDTQLYLRDRLDKNWVFQETMLDDIHYVATALQLNQMGPESKPPVCPTFSVLTPNDLLSTAVPMHQEDMDYWKKFNSREERPNLLNRKPLDRD